MNEMLAAVRRLREKGYKKDEINFLLGGALYRYDRKHYDIACKRARNYK